MIENGLILTGSDAELLSRALLPLTDLDQPALRVSCCAGTLFSFTS
jgi:hypothetical protein